MLIELWYSSQNFTKKNFPQRPKFRNVVLKLAVGGDRTLVGTAVRKLGAFIGSGRGSYISRYSCTETGSVHEALS